MSSLTRCLNEWGFKRRLREAFNPDATFRAAKRIALGSGNDSMSFKAGRPSDSVPFWLPTAYLIGASFAISHASVMRTGMTQIRAAVCCESCQPVSIFCCLTLASTPSASRCTNKRSQGNISNAESILVFSPLESGKCAAQFRRVACFKIALLEVALPDVPDWDSFVGEYSRIANDAGAGGVELLYQVLGECQNFCV